MKPPWDRTTREGAKAIDEAMAMIINRVTAWPTKTIARYLTDKGWKDCGWTGVKHMFEIPSTRPWTWTTTRFSQTQAISFQAYWDLVDQKLIKDRNQTEEGNV